MRIIRVSVLILFLLPGLACAAPRAWVSATIGVGTGVCTRTAPCRTFTYAITQVDAGGEVNALDSGGYGEMTITKAVTVSVPPGVTAGIVASAADGVTINAGVNDEIVLRGLTIQSTMAHHGIKANTFGELHVENSSLNGDGPAAPGFPVGISVNPSTSAKLFVIDTVIRYYYCGIYAHAASGLVNVTIERTRSLGNNEGLFANANSRTTVRESVFSGNAIGMTIYNVQNGTTSAVTAENNTISNNSSRGVYVYADAGGTADATLSGNTLSDNGSGVQFVTLAGITVVRSRGNNTFLRNGSGDVVGGSLTTLAPK